MLTFIQCVNFLKQKMLIIDDIAQVQDPKRSFKNYRTDIAKLTPAPCTTIWQSQY